MTTSHRTPTADVARTTVVVTRLRARGPRGVRAVLRRLALARPIAPAPRP